MKDGLFSMRTCLHTSLSMIRIRKCISRIVMILPEGEVTIKSFPRGEDNSRGTVKLSMSNRENVAVWPTE